MSKGTSPLMRVMFFIPSLGDGGAQRQCIALLNELQRRPGIDLHLMVLASGAHEWRLDASNLTIHRFQVENFASVSALVHVFQTVRQVRPNVVMSWLHPADILMGIVARFFPKLVWIQAERDSKYPPGLTYRVRKVIGRGADRIIANSAPGATYWNNARYRGPIDVIPNIVLAEFRKYRERPVPARILSVGRLEPQKNHEATILACSRLLPEMSGVELRIVGEGSKREDLVALADEVGMSENVAFVGFIDDVASELDSASVVITMSRHEGLPNVLLEALARGVVVVASRIREHTAVLGEEYPYLIDLDSSPDDAAAMVRRALTEQDAAAHLQHGINVVRGLTPENVGSSYMSKFEESISGG
ncbi:glycosyltransferase [Microbacterium sp. A1-JK]|uniref:glycosyltransferase n=1 Tax=Microbacterium sp. A1-JK TaxID=3177516 RepID=UPI00388493AE